MGTWRRARPTVRAGTIGALPGRGYSLRRRLVFAVLGVSALIWLVSLVVVVAVAWHETSDVFDDALKEGARLALVLGAQLQDGADPAAAVARRAPGAPRLKIYYQIVGADGRVLARAQRAPARPFSDDLRASGQFFNVWTQGDFWRVYVLRGPGREFQVQVGQEWDERTGVLTEIAQGLAWPALLLLLLLGAVCWFTIRRLLAPIERTARRIGTKSAQDLSPVPTQDEPLELQPVVAAFNGVLARLDDALQAERRFTADAAHELRTPLAALRMRTQLLVRQYSEGRSEDAHEEAPGRTRTASYPPGEPGEARAGGTDAAQLAQRLMALGQEVDRCTALVENLLILARLDPRQAERLEQESVDLAAEFAQLVRSFPLGQSQRFVIDCQTPTVRAQPVLLRSALRNLADNALRYGAPGGRVELQALPYRGGVRIAVRDDGAGVSPADRARLTERFFRVLGTGQSGSGLGLSIVEKIAVLHQAQLHFGPGIGGAGLGVTIDFPAP